MNIEVNGKVITLNDQQEEALNRLNKFITDKEKLFICLSGYAGTGKSTIIKEITKNQFSVAVTAPTHKAKKVVGRFTGKKAVTIHALLGLQPNMSLEEFDKHNVLFDQLGKEKMGNYKLVVIDEASMIGKDLLALIKKVANQYKTQVIFMGDIIQLAPVNEPSCPVFEDTEIEQVQLTKVMRQQDSNPLMFIYDSIRSDIHSPKDNFSRDTNIKADEGVIFYNEPTQFADKVLEVFKSEEYKNDPSTAKIICWRNETVRQWNNYVRKNLYGSITTPLQKGEVLMAYTNVMAEDKMTPLLQNSAEYKVKIINPAIRDNIEGYWIVLEDVDTSISSKIFVVKPDLINYNMLITTEQAFLKEAKEASATQRKWKWAAYYGFKNKFLIIENITDEQGRILVKKDLDFAYAVTSYKSQGSSYKYVFIDEKDINGNPDHTQRNRHKYVAFSRPTHIAHVLHY